MRYFFEAQRSIVTSDKDVICVTFQADSLALAIRLFQAYLSGKGLEWQMTSATAYKRKGTTYGELSL